MLMLYLDQERRVKDTDPIMSADTCAFIINYMLKCISPAETKALGEVRRDIIELRRDAEFEAGEMARKASKIINLLPKL